jgi:2-keto-3-deoxy-L-rhamnonate aldolase RhmA
MKTHAYTLPAAGEVHLGTFVKTPAPQIVEVLALAGLDFAVLDAEHAPWDRGTLDLALLAGHAAGLPLLVRVAERSAVAILPVLDQGAAGIVVPHVDSAADAHDAVAQARYLGGRRGYSSSPRAGAYGTLGMAETIRRGDNTVVIVQIESEAAVAAVHDILAVPGVAGVLIGRADLALSMGLASTQDARVVAATDRVVKATLAAGRLLGVAVGSDAERERFVAQGANWVVQGSDQGLLRQAAAALRPATQPSAARAS